MKVKEAIRQFLEVQEGVHSPLTIERYERHLSALGPIVQKQVHNVRMDDLLPIWRGLVRRETLYGDHPMRPTIKGKLSPYTLHGYIRSWRTFFHWCIYQEYAKHNPASRLKKPQLPNEPPKALARDDLVRLLEVAASNPRNYAIVCFLADTGCRVGGAAHLLCEDLDLDRGRATVREKGRGGSHNARIVYMKPRTVQVIRDYLAVRSGKHERLFQGGQGNLTEGGFNQLLKRLAKKAGITGRCNPHAFRHGFARGALNNGADLATLSELLGHSSVMVTAKFYARWADEELAKKHHAVSWLPD